MPQKEARGCLVLLWRSHVVRISVLFLLYAIQVVGFANAYRDIHKEDPEAFLFNTAIVERQVGQDLAQIDSKLVPLKRDLEVISTASTFPSLIRSTGATPAYKPALSQRIVLTFNHSGIDMTIWFDLGGLKEHGFMSITDEARPEWRGFEGEAKFNLPDNFLDDHLYPVQDPEMSAKVVEEFSWEMDRETNRLRDLIAGLEKERSAITLQTPKWQFTEYLYFSVSVVGGPGDIIPNSRSVRQIVIAQFFISIAIGVFLVSAVSAGTGGK